MTTERELRRRIGTARRVVVKIGSSAITSFHGGIRRAELDTMADVCQTRMTGGSDVFVVSSGAIGAGMAAVLLAGLRLLGGAEGLTPALPVTWGDLILLSPVPVIAATVALAAARIAAMRTLADGREGV